MRKKKLKTKKIYQRLAFWLGVLVVGAALGSVIQFTRAWVEPTANAPSGNIAAPINTSNTPQAKGNNATTGAANLPKATPGSIVANDFCLPGGDCLSSASGGSGGGIYEACQIGGCGACQSGYRASGCIGAGGFNVGSYYVTFSCTICSSNVSSDCVSSGGVPTQDGSTSFCQFNGSSCPSGWSKYKSWSETSGSTCNGSHVGSCTGRTSCSTGSHAWANTATETCGYKNETTGQTWNPQYYCTQDGGCEGGCTSGYCSGTDVSSCSSNCGEMGCYTYCNPSCSLDSDNSYGCGSYSPYCSTSNATCTANVSKVGCY